MPKWQGEHHYIARQKSKTKSVKVPAHRYTALKKAWIDLYTPIVEQCKLEVRMNLETRSVEIRVGPETEDKTLLTKAADFVNAFLLGFDVADALALIRLDDIYVDTFEVKDVKQTLQGDHTSRAIGRMAGSHGRTRYTLENTTRTRIVIADQKVHILGTFANIRVARRALTELIRGSPAPKVYTSMRTTMNRVLEF